jgi:hypothetical protein
MKSVYDVGGMPAIMKVFVNYATENFFPAQRFSSKMAVKLGGFDRVIENSPATLGAEFKSVHSAILSEARGAGYWLWKPYCILTALYQVNDGDLVMYADSASHFIRPADPLFALPTLTGQDVIPFSLDLPEAHWTKRDAFFLMDCDRQGFEQKPQRLASFILARKSSHSIAFFQDYLNYCSDPRILTDIQNMCDLPNYPGFQDHRHDQSVFSLLSKKLGLSAFRDPSQWGNSQMSAFPNSNYPQLIEHTRQKSPKQATLSYKLKRFFFPK